MTEYEWIKYNKLIPDYNGVKCLYCGGKITRDDCGAEIEYSKTRSGNNFFHTKCFTNKFLKRG